MRANKATNTTLQNTPLHLLHPAEVGVHGWLQLAAHHTF